MYTFSHVVNSLVKLCGYIANCHICKNIQQDSLLVIISLIIIQILIAPDFET